MNSNKPSHPPAQPPRPSTAAALLNQLEMWGLKLGLDRISAVVDALGRPDRDFTVVLVAGTNGKGTTAATLSSILFQAGYRVGLFTSPHLETVRERIRVDGRSISDAELYACLELVKNAAAKRQDDPLPSYFEAITASALLHFSQRGVDIGVLEVGLGGRLDATNVTNPTLSIITSIAHDHQEHLGHTLKLIAAEKAGIARQGRPLLAWAPRQTGVQEVLRAVAAKGVLVEEVWRDLEIEHHARDGLKITCATAPPNDEPRTYNVADAAVAQHQAHNIAIAVRAAERLAELGFSRVNAHAIEGGVGACRWPGRLEVVQLPDATRGSTPDETVECTSPRPHSVLLDGAHNPAGARALAAHLRNLQTSAGTSKTDQAGTGKHAVVSNTETQESVKPNLLFGTLKGKSATTALAELATCVDKIWLTSPTNERALSADELLQRLERYQPQLARRCTVIADFGPALEAAIAATPSRLVICGSLYGVGEARTWLHQRFGVPTPAGETSLFD